LAGTENDRHCWWWLGHLVLLYQGYVRIILQCYLGKDFCQSVLFLGTLFIMSCVSGNVIACM